MSFEERTYRVLVNKVRFDYFTVVHRETDLFIGLPQGKYTGEVYAFVFDEIRRLREILDRFIDGFPVFRDSLEPVDPPGEVPDVIKPLFEASKRAGTGPMAGIAGLFSTHITEKLYAEYKPAEVVIENGGDICAITESDINVSLYAGNSPLSGKLALKVPAGKWGICTSSGTVGHSLSFGKADSVTAIAGSPVVADVFATALANKVGGKNDISKVLDSVACYPELSGCVIIIKDQVGLRGSFELLPMD